MDDSDANLPEGPLSGTERDLLRWAKGAAEEEKERRQKYYSDKSVSKSIRIYESEEAIVERRAEQISLSFSKFARVMLLGGRPDIEAVAALLERIADVTEDLADAAEEGNAGQEITTARETVADVRVAFGG